MRDRVWWSVRGFCNFVDLEKVQRAIHSSLVILVYGRWINFISSNIAARYFDFD